MIHSKSTLTGRGALVAALAASLGGCASLPSSGPTAQAVVSAAEGGAGEAFPIVDISLEVAQRTATPAVDASAGLPPPAQSGLIGPGDVLQITVFEVGASLFTSSPALSSAGSRAIGESLPPIVVGADGAASVPYVGRLQAAGLTPEALAQRIEAGLAGKSQAPQVVVTVREPLAGTVMVSGDVRKPGRIPLTPARERLLDAVALAGGASSSGPDTMLRLVRGASVVETPLADIQAGAADDLVLAPQDRLEVIYRPRTFTVFGAAGKVQEIPFQTARVSLAEALARAGGPSEQLADPSAVFVFRYEPSRPDGAPAPGARPVAYRLNLQRAQSYFLAQRFEMRNRDVLYVAGAASNQPAKVLQILNLFFQPIYTGKVLAQ